MSDSKAQSWLAAPEDEFLNKLHTTFLTDVDKYYEHANKLPPCVALHYKDKISMAQGVQLVQLERTHNGDFVGMISSIADAREKFLVAQAAFEEAKQGLFATYATAIPLARAMPEHLDDVYKTGKLFARQPTMFAVATPTTPAEDDEKENDDVTPKAPDAASTAVDDSPEKTKTKGGNWAAIDHLAPIPRPPRTPRCTVNYRGACMYGVIYDDDADLSRDASPVPESLTARLNSSYLALPAEACEAISTYTNTHTSSRDAAPIRLNIEDGAASSDSEVETPSSSRASSRASSKMETMTSAEMVAAMRAKYGHVKPRINDAASGDSTSSANAASSSRQDVKAPQADDHQANARKSRTRPQTNDATFLMNESIVGDSTLDETAVGEEAPAAGNIIACSTDTYASLPEAARDSIDHATVNRGIVALNEYMLYEHTTTMSRSEMMGVVAPFMQSSQAVFFVKALRAMNVMKRSASGSR